MQNDREALEAQLNDPAIRKRAFEMVKDLAKHMWSILKNAGVPNVTLLDCYHGAAMQLASEVQVALNAYTVLKDENDRLLNRVEKLEKQIAQLDERAKRTMPRGIPAGYEG